MCHAIEICRVRVSKGRNAIVMLMLACCFVSCYDPAKPLCLNEKDSFTATVSEGGRPSFLFALGPCDIGFTKFINSIGGDSIVIDGIASVSGGRETRTIAIRFNIISEGEYTFGVNIIPGEPSGECVYSFYRNDIVPYNAATTNPDGSGIMTIASFSSDYISGTFHATCISTYGTGVPSDSDSVKITSASFSGHLVSN